MKNAIHGLVQEVAFDAAQTVKSNGEVQFSRILTPEEFAALHGRPMPNVFPFDSMFEGLSRHEDHRLPDTPQTASQLAALAAHHMVVIVANAGFVAGGMALRLYLPDDSQLREKLQRIVDSLVRHIGVPFANGRNDGFGIRVRVRSDSGQYRNAGLRNPHRCRLQHLLDPCL